VSKDNEENKLTTKDSGIKVELPGSEWSTHGGDLYNRRYSPLEAINVDTIKDLKPAWTTSLGSGIEFKYSGEATPLVADGVMYVTTGANDVLALDAITGEMLWDYRPEINENRYRLLWLDKPSGVAIGEGKVYATLLDAQLVALDIKTGSDLGNRSGNWQEGYTVTNAALLQRQSLCGCCR
jgi:glucose dehydrogenase